MFNVCPSCGKYRVDKIVTKHGGAPVAVCPACNHAHLFEQLPLFIINGASGTGKSTVTPELTQLLHDVAVVLEGDILFLEQESVVVMANRWMRLCKNIAQSGRPVVLLSGGLIPQNLASSDERRYFSHIHHLALICQPDELKRRLQARPAWRGTDWQAQHDFNRWFIEESGLPLLETTELTVEKTAEKIAAWVRGRL